MTRKDVFDEDYINIIDIKESESRTHRVEASSRICNIEFLCRAYDGIVLRMTTDTGYSVACTYDENFEIVNIPIDFNDHQIEVFSLREIKKKWYEREEAVGKPVWVYNHECTQRKIDIFRKFNPNLREPFICEYNSWGMAEPVVCNDLYMGEK